MTGRDLALGAALGIAGCAGGPATAPAPASAPAEAPASAGAPAAAAETPEAVLAELRARSNGYPRFHVRFRVGGRDRAEGQVEVWYEAPDRIAVRYGSGTHHGVMVARDGAIQVDFQSTADPPMRGAMDLAQARAGVWAATVADWPAALGTRPADPPPSRAGLGLSVAPAGHTTGAPFSFSANLTDGDGPVLQWLAHVTRPGVRLALEPTHLVATFGDGHRLEISRATGFLERVVRSTGEVALELLQLDLDGSAPADVFAIPAPEAAPDPRIRRIAMREALRGTRERVVRVVGDRVREGSLRWTTDVATRCREVLQHAYATAFPHLLDDSVAAIEAWTGAYAQRVGEARAAGEAPASFRERAGTEVAGVRGKLAARLETMRGEARDSFPPPETGSHGPGAWADLVACDREALAAGFDAAIAAPLLARFDRVVEAALLK